VCLQEHTTDSCPEADEFSHKFSLNDLYLSRIPTKTLHEILISLTHVTLFTHLIFYVFVSGERSVPYCPLPQPAVAHTVHVPWLRLWSVVAASNVRAGMELEAYRQNPAKDRLLYTVHFIVVLQNTSVAVSQI
jgi:hypothetical protein